MALSLCFRAGLLCGALALFLQDVVGAQILYTTNSAEYAIEGTRAGDQTRPQLSLSPFGGFLTWQDNSTYAYHTGLGIRAQALDANLSPVGPSFRVNRTGGRNQDHEAPRIGLFNGGGAVWVWQGGRAGLQHIFARFLTSSNTWVGGDIMVNTTTNRYQTDPAIAILNNGNVAIVWSSFNQAAPASMQDIYCAIFSPTGQRLAGEFLVNQFAQFNQRNPAIAALGNGGFVTAWVSEQARSVGAVSNAPSVDVYARLYYPNGAQVGDEFLVSLDPSAAGHPAVVGTTNGGFIAAWDRFDSTRPDNDIDILVRSFSAAAVGGVTSRLNTYTNGDQYAPQLAPLGDGYLAAWTSQGQDGSRAGVFGQFLASDGSLSGPEIGINSTVIGNQRWPAVAGDGSGRVLAVWAGFVSRGSEDLFARRFLSTTYTPVDATNRFAAPAAEIFPDDLPPHNPGGDITGGPIRGNPDTNRTAASLSGSYNGLFYNPSNLTTTSAGFFSARVTDKGAFSARVSFGGKTYPVSGLLDSAGRAVATSQNKSASGLTLELEVHGDVLTGTVSASGWSSALLADRQVFSKAGKVSAQRGTYTWILPPDVRTTAGPAGDGFGSIKVDGNGAVQWLGSLADGSKASQRTAVSGQGYWPMYASLYGGSGMILSWIQFTNQSGNALGGETLWIKPAGVTRGGQKNYREGFTNDVLALGSEYQRPVAGRRALAWRDGDLILAGGGLDDFFTNSVRLELNNRLVNQDGGKLNFVLNAGAGSFKGSALVPGSARPLTFQGALHQSTNIGLGYFLNGNLSGQIYLGPSPAPATNSSGGVNP